MELSCPIPITDYENINIAHGGGGTLSRNLIKKMFAGHYNNPLLNTLRDSAVFPAGGTRLAFTTDSFVVSPLFFRGGNIGDLAVNGTVNDLAMSGASPKFISVAMIIEEGFPMSDLWVIVQSIRRAAEEAGVQIVTGDTKVVEKGKGDKIFINTSGIGIIKEGREIDPAKCGIGDKIILSGTIGDHGTAILMEREGMKFDSGIESDTAPLNGLVEEMFSVSENIFVLRDPTRGGVSSALNEIAEDCGKEIMIYEERIPVSSHVNAACGILGLDPLYIANEGKLIAVVKNEDAGRMLSKMRVHPLGKDSAIIGEITGEKIPRVIMQTSIGTKRIIDMISGEQLPRIC